MKLPDTLKTDKNEIPEEEWKIVRNKIIESVNILNQFRQEEGTSIMNDMQKCIMKILSLLDNIGASEPERIIRVRDKIKSLLEENIGSDKIDNNRFEQELIYYLEKFDINEEKVRLKTHCDYFLDTLNTASPNGKLLNFICQEIGREINTIGSKANDASIQKLVVMMKDELEKIKEQTLNVL
jgi:uncharacterized protein (TIGR00255 family)